jgi:hypothetical protein
MRFLIILAIVLLSGCATRHEGKFGEYHHQIEFLGFKAGGVLTMKALTFNQPDHRRVRTRRIHARRRVIGWSETRQFGSFNNNNHQNKEYIETSVKAGHTRGFANRRYKVHN